MDIENNIEKSAMELLQSEDPAEKIEAINLLLFEEIDEFTVKFIGRMIGDPDKGIRNAVANFLITNSHPSIPSMVVDLTASSNITLRNLAGEILLSKGDSAFESIIEKLHGCTNDDNIKFMVDILGLIGNINSEDQLIEILSANQNDNVIVACIEALGNIRSEKGLESIIIFYDQNEVFKPVVVDALGKIGGKKAMEFILAKLNDSDDLIKFTIVESLGDIGDEEIFYVLLSKLNEVSGALSWAVLEAVYKLKFKYNLEVPFDEKIKKCVLETIQNADPKYQLIAAHLVTVFEDPEILFACLQIFGADSELDEVLREKFFENKTVIIERISDIIKSSQRNLLAILSLFQEIYFLDPAPVIQLEEIEKLKLAQMLSDQLNNSDEMIRILSAEILFRVSPDTAFLFIDVLKTDENMWNRIKLLDILSEFNRAESYKVLKELANDPEEMVANKANEILEQLKNNKVK